MEKNPIRLPTLSRKRKRSSSWAAISSYFEASPLPIRSRCSRGWSAGRSGNGNNHLAERFRRSRGSRRRRNLEWRRYSQRPFVESDLSNHFGFHPFHGAIFSRSIRGNDVPAPSHHKVIVARFPPYYDLRAVNLNSTLNFLGGLLAFLAVLMPLTLKGWRLARKKGKQRDVLTLIFFALGVVAMMLAMAWQYWHFPIGTLVAGASALFLTITGFTIDPSPIRRIDIIIVALIGAFFSMTVTVVLVRVHIDVGHDRHHHIPAAVPLSPLPPARSSTPTATPSSS